MSSRDSGDTKRRRTSPFIPTWKRARDLPAFLDASATVSASTFGARRLPEIKALWNVATAAHNRRSSSSNIPSEQVLKSSGGKTSSRHLRRRTTSHKSRKRHRYPVAAPKAKELLSSSSSSPNGAEHKTPTVTESRRKRRKNRTRLCEEHEAWMATKNGVVGAPPVSKTETIAQKSCSQGVNWMTTHIWHCKRFHMAALWGWQVPMVHTNRGPKAALRLIREGKTLLQDVTWKMGQPIVVEGTRSLEGTTTEADIQAALQRLCPNFQLVAKQQDDDLVETGRGMVYTLDQFPRNAIGPTAWLISRRRPLMGGIATNNAASTYYIYFWVDPAIQNQVWDQFEKLHGVCESSSDQQSSTIPNFQVGFHPARADPKSTPRIGMSCLQLRGINATTTLQKVLALDQSPARENPAGNQRLLDNDALHTILPSGTGIAVDITLSQPQASDESSDDAAKSSSPWIEGCRALVVSHCICDPRNLPQNAPAMGWNVYCDADVAKDLFVALVLTGQACPIGVVEEAYMNLECQPPIANVFPRDFPETEEGRKYWQLGNGGSDNSTSVSDLKTLRLCLEEGEMGGRVAVPTIKLRSQVSTTLPSGNEQLMAKISTKQLCRIHWNDLVTGGADAKNEDEDDPENSASIRQQTEGVVMMRGMFGKPLVDVLSGGGKVSIRPTSEEQNKPAARKRRRVKRPNELCHVIPLSREEADTHLTSCTALLQSLSLPAVIACHLQVVGCGMLQPGAQIHSRKSKEDCSRLLGYVTAGTFSVARGCSHGMGVLGASCLLHAIVEAFATVQQAQNALAVVQTQGKKHINLVVDIKHGALTMTATLALLL